MKMKRAAAGADFGGAGGITRKLKRNKDFTGKRRPVG